MKKRIVLIAAIVLVCVALLCGVLIMNFKKLSETEKSTTTTTTSTTKATTTREPIVPTFEHGDNLTDEDFYFIIEKAEYLSEPYWVTLYDDFSGFLKYMKLGITYYEISVDFSSAYYICAYLSKDYYETSPFSFPPFSVENGYLVDEFVWYKFAQGETVPEQIDNCDFIGGFILFDCTIERDILNDKECNYKCKYYAPLENGYADIGVDLTSKYCDVNNRILRYSKDLELISYIFLTSNAYQNYYRSNTFVKPIVYNGEMYLMVDSSSDAYNSEIFSFEKHREEVGSRYDEIVPYLKIIEYTDGNQGYYVAISIDSFVELLNTIPFEYKSIFD